MNPFHIHAPCFFRTNFNIILPSAHESHKWQLLFRFPTKMCTHLTSHVYITCPVWHPPYFGQLNGVNCNICEDPRAIFSSLLLFHMSLMHGFSSPASPYTREVLLCYRKPERDCEIYDKFSASFETISSYSFVYLYQRNKRTR